MQSCHFQGEVAGTEPAGGGSGVTVTQAGGEARQCEVSSQTCHVKPQRKRPGDEDSAGLWGTRASCVLNTVPSGDVLEPLPTVFSPGCGLLQLRSSGGGCPGLSVLMVTAQ